MVVVHIVVTVRIIPLPHFLAASNARLNTARTLLHPGVKAPGTAKITPFLPLKRSRSLTSTPGRDAIHSC